MLAKFLNNFLLKKKLNKQINHLIKLAYSKL